MQAPICKKSGISCIDRHSHLLKKKRLSCPQKSFQHFNTGVPENPGEPITSVMDLNIGYTYDDGNGAAFDITILFDRELYLSCKGSNFIHVVT